MNYKTIVLFAVLILCITFIFSISNVTLYATKNNYNDITDEIGLSLADYFLGAGLIGFAFISVWLLTLFTNINLYGIMVLSFIVSLSMFIWTIIGGVIIFRGNIELIQYKESVAIYAVVLWSFSVLAIIMDLTLKKVLYSYSPKRRELYRVLFM